ALRRLSLKGRAARGVFLEGTDGMAGIDRENSFTERLLMNLRSVVKKYSPACKQITALVSRSLDRQLSFRQRLLLRLHLFGCRACALFREQLRLLRSLVRRRAQSADFATSPETILPAEARERIGLALRRKYGQPSRP
ncbi:MAG: zf-HC2 domain-containing protein, partial [Pyrinomonadaceae bacterium]